MSWNVISRSLFLLKTIQGCHGAMLSTLVFIYHYMVLEGSSRTCIVLGFETLIQNGGGLWLKCVVKYCRILFPLLLSSRSLLSLSLYFLYSIICMKIQVRKMFELTIYWVGVLVPLQRVCAVGEVNWSF